MKKVLSTLVAALVAVAFAGVVFAAEPAPAPAAAPAAGEVKKEERPDVVRDQVRRGAPFAYSITLPEAVDADAIGASLESGVLRVTVPKSKPSQRRRIELK